MIESVLTLFEMQVEFVGRDAMKLLQAMFGITPERLNAVDMLCASGKFIRAMTDSEVLAVTDINESVIPAPAVTMDNRLWRDPTANNGLQSSFLAVRNDLGINLAIALQQSEDDSLTARSATAFASHATSTKVRFVNFDFAARQRRIALRFFTDTTADFEKDHCHTLARQTRELGDIRGGKIKRKVAQQLAKFLGGNSGTAVERVWSFHVSSLALP